MRSVSAMNSILILFNPMLSNLDPFGKLRIQSRAAGVSYSSVLFLTHVFHTKFSRL